MSELKGQITADMKTAMKAGEKLKLLTIRNILAAIKQIEVDERIELDDTRVLVVLDKMAKQRRESISQFEAADRQELADVEKAEIGIIKQYLPEALDDATIAEIIKEAIETSGATEMRDMGKVMGIIKPKIQGRADMGAVSGKIKALLNV